METSEGRVRQGAGAEDARDAATRANIEGAERSRLAEEGQGQGTLRRTIADRPEISHANYQQMHNRINNAVEDGVLDARFEAPNLTRTLREVYENGWDKVGASRRNQLEAFFGGRTPSTSRVPNAPGVTRRRSGKSVPGIHQGTPPGPGAPSRNRKSPTQLRAEEKAAQKAIDAKFKQDSNKVREISRKDARERAAAAASGESRRTPASREGSP